MKVAQEPRGTARFRGGLSARTARFRRYELVSVCGIWQWRRHSWLLSPRAFFWCLVFDVCQNRFECREAASTAGQQLNGMLKIHDWAGVRRRRSVLTQADLRWFR